MCSQGGKALGRASFFGMKGNAFAIITFFKDVWAWRKISFGE